MDCNCEIVVVAFLIYGLSDEYQHSLTYGADNYHHYTPPSYKSPPSYEGNVDETHI